MGVGDEIMVTGEARRLQQRDPRPVLVTDRHGRPRWHPIWENNPRIVRSDRCAGAGVRRHWPAAWGEFQILRNAGHCRPYVDYARSTKQRWAYTDWRATPGEFYFSDKETTHAAEAARALGRFVVIEPHIKTTASPNKDWGWHRWQETARLLSGTVRLVQLGPLGVPRLAGVEHVWTKDFRIACAILARAAAYLGPEGGLHHAAAALGRPAVVVFGSMMSPVNTAYDGHVNLTVADDHSPCGLRVACPRCAANFASIRPETVAAHLRSLL